MNAGVPIATPAPVSVAPEPCESAFAMPKSVTMTRPRVPSSRMLSGLMSRCTTETAWAALSASALSFMIRRASSGGSWPSALHPAGDRLAVHVAHDEVDDALGLTDRVDRHDVRMEQLAGGLRLALEALADVLLEGELGRQHLDRDPALELLVARAVDDAHAAPPDFSLEGVGGAQRLSDASGKRLVDCFGHPRDGLRSYG